MSNLITKKDGTPFATERAAKSQQAIRFNKGIDTEIVKVEGGFALKEKSAVEPSPPETPLPVRETQTEKQPDTPPRRRKRVSLGKRNVLAYPVRPGYRRRMVNDVDDRVLIFQEAGWEPVKQQDLLDQDDRRMEASQMGLTARKPVGGGVHGVLMEIPEDWYLEDQQAKQDEVKRLEDDMRRNRAGIDGAYGSIDIQ